MSLLTRSILVDPDDIVFGPPRTAFSSARGNKSFDGDRILKDGGDLPGRFDMRGRNGDGDSERGRESRTNNFRRRDESDQDSEGWSTVKPRKSFGHEGAERFHGKMGGNFRDDKRPVRDKDERPARPLDGVSREKEASVDGEGRLKTAAPGRSKLDSWHRGDSHDIPASAEKRERADRLKSWRDRDRPAEMADERGVGKTGDKRWGRDREVRSEREPEWMDEPAEGQREAHTQQDFQKWMEQMKKAKSDASASGPVSVSATDRSVPNIIPQAVIEAEQPPVQPAPAIEVGPDKFFLAFGSGSGLDATTPGESPRDTPPAAKPKAAGKSSRFTSFFAHGADEPRGRTEPPMPLMAPPADTWPGPAVAAGPEPDLMPPPEEEKKAFQQLLMKLQKQGMSATPPGLSPFAPPSQAMPPGLMADTGKKSAITSPDPWQQYGERREGPMQRPPSQRGQEIVSPRPQQQSARPEQLLQDLVGHHQRASSQGSGRPEYGDRNNSNTEFLMNLMRAGPEGPRPDLHMMRMNQPPFPPQPPSQQGQRPPSLQGLVNEREPGPPRQMRSQPPPGFPMEEPFPGGDRDTRPNHPTQILQRPNPPPGLDQMPLNWMPGGGGQMPPPQQRGPMMPPPGLSGGPGPKRNMPMPQMFPPNFPPGAGMPPPLEGISGMPPRNGPPPPLPPGFFNGPPHGFMPPGLGGFNGPPGMDAHSFVGSPFEGRGMPPPPGNGRGANFNGP